jgi:Zn-dependent M28 family amino/carboxypeptidase
MGAHSDSVPEGPGINDNGSGSAAILEVAIQLSKFAIKNRVRFGWWTAEEEGLLGAEQYVGLLSPEELFKIRLYLNFDMVASGNGYLAR